MTATVGKGCKISSIKKEIIELINGLPERADYDDIMAEINFKQKVDKSLRQIEKGEVVEEDEAKKDYQSG